MCSGLSSPTVQRFDERSKAKMDRKTITKAIGYSGVSQAELARKLGITPATFSNRLNKCRFSSDELEQIAAAIGAEYVEYFQFSDGVAVKPSKEHA